MDFLKNQDFLSITLAQNLPNHLTGTASRLTAINILKLDLWSNFPLKDQATYNQKKFQKNHLKNYPFKSFRDMETKLLRKRSCPKSTAG